MSDRETRAVRARESARQEKNRYKRRCRELQSKLDAIRERCSGLTHDGVHRDILAIIDGRDSGDES